MAFVKLTWTTTKAPIHINVDHDFGRLTVSIIVGLRSLRATNTRRDLIKAAT